MDWPTYGDQDERTKANEQSRKIIINQSQTKDKTLLHYSVSKVQRLPVRISCFRSPRNSKTPSNARYNKVSNPYDRHLGMVKQADLRIVVLMQARSLLPGSSGRNDETIRQKWSPWKSRREVVTSSEPGNSSESWLHHFIRASGTFYPLIQSAIGLLSYCQQGWEKTSQTPREKKTIAEAGA